MKFSSWKV